MKTKTKKHNNAHIDNSNGKSNPVEECVKQIGKDYAKYMFEKMKSRVLAFNGESEMEMSDFEKDTANLLFKMSYTALSFQQNCSDIIDMFAHGKITEEQCEFLVQRYHLAIESINKMVLTCIKTFDKR